MKNPQSTTEKNKGVTIEPLNKKGLANVLGVSVYILNRMLELCKEEVGKPIGTMYSQRQVQYMINRFGILKDK